jgi:AcrR family transcriptional regulator
MVRRSTQLAQTAPETRALQRDRAQAGFARLNKHQLKTEATRGKLLQAAYRIFTRDGFEAARIEDIAAEAGYTRGAFYAHFQTKEDLFFSLLEQEASNNMRKLATALQNRSGREQQRDTLREFYMARSADRRWTILLLEFKLYAIRHPKLRAQLAAAHRRVRKTLSKSLMKDCFPHSCAPEKTWELIKVGLEAAFTGLVLERAYDPKRVSEGQVRALLGQVFDAFTLPL